MAKIAYVYANSLFEIAKEKEKLDVCKQAYDDFINIYRDDVVKKFFSNPIISNDDKLSFINNVCVNFEKIFQNFLKVLIKKGRENYIEECYDVFNEILSEFKNEVTVEVKSANKLRDEQLNNIIKNIESNTGKKVKLVEVIDPSLLMGFDILIDGKLLDMSLEATFERLRKKLRKIEVKL